jgi:hypothetical protein
MVIHNLDLIRRDDLLLEVKIKSKGKQKAYLEQDSRLS